MSDSWLKLHKELILSNLAEVIFVGLLGIILNAIIELLAEVLGSAFFQLTKPHLNVFHSLVNDVLESAF